MPPHLEMSNFLSNSHFTSTFKLKCHQNSHTNKKRKKRFTIEKRAMGFLTSLLCGFLLTMVFSVSNGDPLVPALCIFGDSVVDVGNNNNLSTLIKANFPPYGRDFVTHKPTGRFCNGKLATDFTAEYLGFTSYPPAYLSREARGKRVLTGVNFASAASGYYERTARLFNLYDLGARRIGVTTLPPTGCLPAAITLFGRGTNECVAKLNKDAISFNKKLNRTSQKLKSKLPGIKLVVFDIYQPLFDLITKPAQ